MRFHRFAFGLVVMAVAGVLIRVAYVVELGQRMRLGLDSVWYSLAAYPVSRGQGYLDPGLLFQRGAHRATAAWPPLYPTFLALVVRVGHRTSFRYRIADCGLGA